MSKRTARIFAWSALACLGVVSMLTASGCETRSPLRIRPGPVIKARRLGITAPALKRIAVIPFYPAERLRAPSAVDGATAPGAPSAWEAAAIVANMVGDALAGAGVEVIPSSDVELAFTGEGRPVPRLDPRAAAEQASRSFGATGVVLGQVMRYRDREGSAVGATRGASVAFELSLYDVPGARKLWEGRFDETQTTVTDNILRARSYPGGGTRWLSAAEFARWGADEAVQAMMTGP